MQQLHIRSKIHTRHRRPQILHGSRERCDLLHCFPARWSDELRTETIGSIGILTYWILVRLLQRSTALGSEDVDHIRRIAYGMKFIWREISKTLFTLKAHCFIDHSTLEDMSESLDVQWLRVGASKTAAASFPGRKDCEETIVKNFVLKKKLIHDLLRQAENTGHRNFIKLSDAIAGEKKRFPPAKILSAEWNFPVHSTVRFSSLDESDAMALRRFYRNISLSSRLVHDYGSHRTAYCSKKHWTRTSNSTVSCVQVAVGGEVLFGELLLFIYDPVRDTCFMLLDEFVVEDPFQCFAQAFSTDVTNAAIDHCINTLFLIQPQNRFFKRVIGRTLNLVSAFDVYSPAVTIRFGERLFVSQIP